MYTKLFHLKPLNIPTLSSRPIITRPVIKADSPQFENMLKRAVELEYVEQKKYEQELATYNKIKMEIEPQPTDANKKSETMTPKEAAGKVLDAAFVKLRSHLGTYGDSLNLIEHPLRTYAFPKFEKIFTYFAKDGRVDKQTVDKFSNYALLVIVLVAIGLVYEKVKSQREKIKKMDQEYEEFDKKYSQGAYEYEDAMKARVEKQTKLQELTNELDKYENILAKLEASQQEIFLKSKEQPILRQIWEQLLSFVVSPEERQAEQLKSYLKEKSNDTGAELTARELAKWGSVDAVIISAEDKINDLSKKVESTEEKIKQINSHINEIAKYVVETGDIRDDKRKSLERIWGYSFFSQHAKKTEETSLPEVPQIRNDI